MIHIGDYPFKNIGDLELKQISQKIENDVKEWVLSHSSVKSKDNVIIAYDEAFNLEVGIKYGENIRKIGEILHSQHDNGDISIYIDLLPMCLTCKYFLPETQRCQHPHYGPVISSLLKLSTDICAYHRVEGAQE